jgi:hypothetical protein
MDRTPEVRERGARLEHHDLPWMQGNLAYLRDPIPQPGGLRQGEEIVEAGPETLLVQLLGVSPGRDPLLAAALAKLSISERHRHPCVISSSSSYRRTSISGTTFSGKKCLSGTIFHAI